MTLGIVGTSCKFSQERRSTLHWYSNLVQLPSLKCSRWVLAHSSYYHVPIPLLFCIPAIPHILFCPLWIFSFLIFVSFWCLLLPLPLPTLQGVWEGIHWCSGVKHYVLLQLRWVLQGQSLNDQTAAWACIPVHPRCLHNWLYSTRGCHKRTGGH